MLWNILHGDGLQGSRCPLDYLISWCLWRRRQHHLLLYNLSCLVRRHCRRCLMVVLQLVMVLVVEMVLLLLLLLHNHVGLLRTTGTAQNDLMNRPLLYDRLRLRLLMHYHLLSTRCGYYHLLRLTTDRLLNRGARYLGATATGVHMLLLLL